MKEFFYIRIVFIVGITLHSNFYFQNHSTNKISEIGQKGNVGKFEEYIHYFTNDENIPFDFPVSAPEIPFEVEEENEIYQSNSKGLYKSNLDFSYFLKEFTPSAIKLYNLSIANHEVIKIYDVYQSWKFDPA